MDATAAVQTEGWARIRALLPPDFAQRARDMGLIRPQPAQLGAKVQDIEPVLRLVLYLAAAGASLRHTAAQGAAAGILSLSPVALHLWLRRLGEYLSVLVGEVWDAGGRYGPERWAGYDIRVADATAVAGPGARGMSARVHYALRLQDGHLAQVHVTSPKGGESFVRFAPGAGPGQLWKADRGYCHARGIRALVARGADVLVRFCRGTLVLHEKRSGTPLDVLALARGLEGRRAVLDVDVVLPADAQGQPALPGRFILQALPPDKAEAARARLRKGAKKRQPVTPEALYWAGFIALFTTVPRARLSGTRLLQLYRGRWQVELHIKRDKSLSGAGALPNTREDTVRSWLTAKLLAIALARRLGAEAFPPSSQRCH